MAFFNSGKYIMITRKDISELFPFSQLSQSESVKLLKECKVKSYRQGKVIYYQGDEADGAFLISSGSFKNILYRDDESSILMNRFLSGDLCGASESIVGGQYLTDVIAENVSTALWIPTGVIFAMLANDLSRDFIIRQLSKNIYSAYYHLSGESPQKKIIRFLKSETGKTVTITQSELADTIGLTRETVNRYLNQMRKDGQIEIKRKSISLISEEDSQNENDDL
jgi:CRP-like cAMP-binding protein